MNTSQDLSDLITNLLMSMSISQKKNGINFRLACNLINMAQDINQLKVSRFGITVSLFELICYQISAIYDTSYSIINSSTIDENDFKFITWVVKPCSNIRHVYESNAYTYFKLYLHQLFNILVKHVDVNKYDPIYNYPPIFFVLSTKNQEFAKTLVNYGANINMQMDTRYIDNMGYNTLFTYSMCDVKNGYVFNIYEYVLSDIRFMLELGLQEQQCTANTSTIAQTILGYIINYCNYHEPLEKFIDMIDMFAKYNILTSINTHDGSTILFSAVYFGVKHFEYVLQYDSDIGRQDYNGDTILHKICKHYCEQESHEMITFLLNLGADPNVYNNSNHTPFEYLCGIRCDPDIYSNNYRMGYYFDFEPDMDDNYFKCVKMIATFTDTDLLNKQLSLLNCDLSDLINGSDIEEDVSDTIRINRDKTAEIIKGVLGKRVTIKSSTSNSFMC